MGFLSDDGCTAFHLYRLESQLVTAEQGLECRLLVQWKPVSCSCTCAMSVSHNPCPGTACDLRQAQQIPSAFASQQAIVLSRSISMLKTSLTMTVLMLMMAIQQGL